RTRVLVVSCGVKSLLDVPATAELLETLGVPALGWQTDELPLFYAARGGPPVSARVETEEEAARIAAANWGLGGGGILLARRPPRSGSRPGRRAIAARFGRRGRGALCGAGRRCHASEARAAGARQEWAWQGRTPAARRAREEWAWPDGTPAARRARELIGHGS